MKNHQIITLLVLVLSFFNVFGQEITLTPKKMPFYEIVEWPNKGVLVLGKDPLKTTLQQEVSFINNEGITQWQEQFLPQTEQPKLILSEYSDYLYFLDQLKPENDKIFYSQTSSNGYIKKGSIFFPPLFRSVADVDYTSSELVEIVNTKDNLIFQFRLKDKKNKSYQDVLIFLNHYSLKTFATKVPGLFSFEMLDKGEKSLIYFAGCKENENYFAHHTIKDKKSGFEILIFDKKGTMTGSFFMVSPKDENLIRTNKKALYPSASFYSNTTDFSSKGILHFQNNEWTLIGNKENTLSFWYYEQNKPILIIDKFDVTFKKNNVHEVGCTVLQNNLIVVSKTDIESKIVVIDLSDKKIRYTHTIKGNFNPLNLSSVLNSTIRTNFSYLFNNKWYITKEKSFTNELTPLVFNAE
jgi:hypothetical protein